MIGQTITTVLIVTVTAALLIASLFGERILAAYKKRTDKDKKTAPGQTVKK